MNDTGTVCSVYRVCSFCSVFCVCSDNSMDIERVQICSPQAPFIDIDTDNITQMFNTYCSILPLLVLLWPIFYSAVLSKDCAELCWLSVQLCAVVTGPVKRR